MLAKEGKHTEYDGDCERVAVFRVLKKTFTCRMLETSSALVCGVSCVMSMFILPAATGCRDRAAVTSTGPPTAADKLSGFNRFANFAVKVRFRKLLRESSIQNTTSSIIPNISMILIEGTQTDMIQASESIRFKYSHAILQ